MEFLTILLLVIIAGLAIWFVVRRKKSSDQNPGLVPTPVPVPGKPADGPAQNVTPAVRPVVIYEDSFRDVRVCPYCDGESDRYAVRCRICGGRL